MLIDIFPYNKYLNIYLFIFLPFCLWHFKLKNVVINIGFTTIDIYNNIYLEFGLNDRYND